MARILVTGSRQVLDQTPIYRELTLAYAEWFQAPQRGHDEPFTVVHGGAPGADMLAGQWVWDNRLELRPAPAQEVHPADWPRYGGMAGRIRNHHMVRLGADLVLAFFQVGAANRGTRHCVEEAQRWLAHKGVPIREIWVQ